MRLALLLVASLAACTPEIAAGAYACGPDEACPEGQACNLADNMCVLPGLVEPFACTPDPSIVPEPDDTPDAATTLNNIQCTTLPLVLDSCMLEGDTSDWFELTAPSGCPSLGIDARISYAIAFEELTLELVDLGTNTTIATTEPCASEDDAAITLECLTASLAADGHYGLHVFPSGEGDCDGDCQFNRYALRIQLGPQ